MPTLINHIMKYKIFSKHSIFQLHNIQLTLFEPLALSGARPQHYIMPISKKFITESGTEWSQINF